LRQCPLSGAGSTGRCNTGVKSLCGGFESTRNYETRCAGRVIHSGRARGKLYNVLIGFHRAPPRPTARLNPSRAMELESHLSMGAGWHWGLRACTRLLLRHRSADPSLSIAKRRDLRHGPPLSETRGINSESGRQRLGSGRIVRLGASPCIEADLAQDIESARISQEVPERFYNRLAVGEGGRCLKWLLDGTDAKARGAPLVPCGMVESKLRGAALRGSAGHMRGPSKLCARFSGGILIPPSVRSGPPHGPSDSRAVKGTSAAARCGPSAAAASCRTSAP
jgi:hypothetical protein